MYSPVLIHALDGILMHEGSLGYDYMDSMVRKGRLGNVVESWYDGSAISFGSWLNSLLMYWRWFFASLNGYLDGLKVWSYASLYGEIRVVIVKVAAILLLMQMFPFVCFGSEKILVFCYFDEGNVVIVCCRIIRNDGVILIYSMISRISWMLYLKNLSALDLKHMWMQQFSKCCATLLKCCIIE